ncbi:SDR family NAD(P)-dependent oxidoreductase [Bacillus sp. S14(2024)]|uniref:SDR family NAD(P)-dependent oxidoreductase n=1 Tax=Bacillus sp. S14(2024) TaxID=3162884 RepID=UPI003D1A2B68
MVIKLRYGEFYDMSIGEWKEIMDINLWGAIYGTQVGYNLMKEQGFGHIVNTASAVNIDKSVITKQLKKQKMMPPQQLAKITLAGIHKNKPIICPMPMRRTMDIIFTLFPSVHRKLMRFVCTVSRKARLN